MTYDTMTDRELDAAVAEKVMGWKLVNCDTDEPATTAAHYRHAANNDGWAWLGRSGDDYAYAWSPSTSIADAFEVVEKMRNTPGCYGRRWRFLVDDSGSAYEATFQDVENGGNFDMMDKSLPRAICIAALMAVAKEAP